MRCLRGRLCGGSVRFGTAVVHVPPPLGADGLVQPGVGEQPLDLRRELFEPSLEVATGVASGPGSPVLFVCVSVTSCRSYKFAPQVMRLCRHVGRLTTRLADWFRLRLVPEDREATVAPHLALLVTPAQERHEEEDREQR